MTDEALLRQFERDASDELVSTVSNKFYYDFKAQKLAWANPPVDDLGYLSSAELSEMPNAVLRQLIQEAAGRRYGGWRNHRNLWREKLGLDTTTGKRILDFGCGIGLEALQFAPRNEVVVADIVPSNVRLSVRVAKLFGCRVEPAIIEQEWPFISLERVDIFYCNGVLHHLPYAELVLRRAAQLANEIRLMLYSDRGWRKYVGSEPPSIERDVREHPDFVRFVRTFDEVGSYADYYNEEKIRFRFGSFLSLSSFDYITNDGRYCVAVLKPL